MNKHEKFLTELIRWYDTGVEPSSPTGIPWEMTHQQIAMQSGKPWLLVDLKRAIDSQRDAHFITFDEMLLVKEEL